jgi:hypothetical protein
MVLSETCPCPACDLMPVVTLLLPGHWMQDAIHNWQQVHKVLILLVDDG